ncbi:hypothetical protein J2I47_24250 [Fibrella sp. HMF5335]|uniref:DUF4136 domain-containing protein n=1 Tax=Fibrella rubiginis TaxID=2817060 RepID=A0A939GMT4_9BACT|nr:hypothetical protein [Fibrella rubiginis]MBO0939681.1 hypothetical protein [Fibrella rubiginis]
MRYVIILAVLLLGACASKNNTIQPAVTNTGDPIYTDPTSWTSIQLNTAYTIKFPAGYEGPGAVGFEGLSFGKNRVDKRAMLSYSFCGPLLCNEYGNPLFGGDPLGGKTPVTMAYGGQTLTKSVVLTQGNTINGIFYYSEAPKAVGVLYLLDRGVFKESLNAQFDSEVQAEVITIIKTIQPKV